MNEARESSPLVDALAGYWTEPALEILKSAGVRQVTVDMEIATWEAVKKVLHMQLRWQPKFQVPLPVYLKALKELVLRRAALLVAQRFEPVAVTFKLITRIALAASDRPWTPAERRLYAKIAGQPAPQAALQPPVRTEFTPRLRVSAVGG
jgi:hypothetical protein